MRRWLTFLRNHSDLIAAMDFFVVPTVRFQLLPLIREVSGQIEQLEASRR